MLLQALMTSSQHIRPFGGQALIRAGEAQLHSPLSLTQRNPAFPPYRAVLFQPGAQRPFRIQRAGRELLDPMNRPLPESDAFESLFVN